MRKILMGSISMVLMMSFNTQAEDTVELEPGLYAFKTIVDIGQQTVHQEEYEYCIYEGNNSRSFVELIDEISGDGDCDVSNVRFGAGKGTASVMCPDTGLGFPIMGQMDGYYTSTTYGATTVAKSPMGEADITVTTTVKRLVDCPEGWTPPEGYSDED